MLVPKVSLDRPLVQRLATLAVVGGRSQADSERVAGPFHVLLKFTKMAAKDGAVSTWVASSARETSRTLERGIFRVSARSCDGGQHGATHMYGKPL